MKYKNNLDNMLYEELHLITQNAPDVLKESVKHAVFPGGGRIRPKLCLATANALSGITTKTVLGAAAAVELIHCASLVHDDMPCFDNADFRRGKPSVHKLYGERIALLTGDGLIAAAFEVLSRNAAKNPCFPQLVLELARTAGASDGLVSGQAWEDRAEVDYRTVHNRKTGALFEASAAMAAIAMGRDPEPWRIMGQRLGEAYQAADDILDVAGSSKSAGKPVRQDLRNDAASLVASSGLINAVYKFESLVEQAINAVPDCKGKSELILLVRAIADRLCPPSLALKIKSTQHLNNHIFNIDSSRLLSTSIQTA